MTIRTTKNELFKKYAIDPSKILIKGELTNTNDKEDVIYNLLYIYELSKSNFKKGLITLSSYSAAIVTDDNSVYFGVNLNNTRNEISSVCAERSALIETYTKKVEEFNQTGKFNCKIKYILMNCYMGENVFWSEKITPCADCLAWFNTGSYISKDTKLIYLKKENNTIYLNVQNLSSFLPLRNLTYSKPVEITNEIKINKTELAKTVDINELELIELYNKTYLAYKNNSLSNTSGQNIAVGIISNDEIFTAKKVDFSKRWFIDPLLAASYKAIEKFDEKTAIKAICYLGEDFTITETNQKNYDGLINVKSLGRLNTKFANSKTLVLTYQKDGLHLATVEDYLPREFKFIHNYEIK